METAILLIEERIEQIRGLQDDMNSYGQLLMDERINELYKLKYKLESVLDNSIV